MKKHLETVIWATVIAAGLFTIACSFITWLH